MSKEITINASVNLQNGLLALNKQSNGTADQAAELYSAQAVTIPTTAGGTALDLGGVTNPGYAYLRNLDAVNFVQVGIVVSAVFHPVLKLKAGEQGVIRFDVSAVPYALADTAAVILDYVILSD